MKAMYNRQTKNVWLEHDDGSVEQLGTAATKLIAYDKIGEVGYMSSTDWRLCVGAIVRKPPPVVDDEQIDAMHRLFARPAAMEVPYPWAEPDIPLHGRWTRHEPIDDMDSKGCRVRGDFEVPLWEQPDKPEAGDVVLN